MNFIIIFITKYLHACIQTCMRDQFTSLQKSKSGAHHIYILLLYKLSSLHRVTLITSPPFLLSPSSPPPRIKKNLK